MTARRRKLLLLALVAAGWLAVFWWAFPYVFPGANRPKGAEAPAVQSKTSGSAAVAPGRDEPSPLAEALNAPTQSVREDVRIVVDLLEAWRTNFPGRGNPVGDNREVTAALAGGNPLQFAFISPRHAAINAEGELCDRWGTPFRLHAWSGDVMEVISAGPDRRFGTADDVRSGEPPRGE